MRVYISGVISKGGTLSGEEIQANLKTFYDAEEIVRATGHEPVNPVALHGSAVGFSTDRETWKYYLCQDIKVLLDCHGIYMLDGWSESKGARLEKHIAEELGLTVLNF